MVFGWLFRVSLVLAVVGLIAFDGVAVVVARVGATDDAATAARAAADAFQSSKDVDSAYAAAQAAAAQHGEEVPAKEFGVTSDGTVSLKVHRTATTIFLWRVPKAKELIKIDATATARAAA